MVGNLFVKRNRSTDPKLIGSVFLSKGNYSSKLSTTNSITVFVFTGKS
jgi:hypothetical protein